MRNSAILAAVLLAVSALVVVPALAKPPANYRYGYAYPSYNGYYYPGYYNGGSAQPYAVQRPVTGSPASGGTGLPIKIVNPAANNTTLSYVLGGSLYTISPGSSQDLVHDRSWVIEFNRGGNFGQARYTLEAGLYTFTGTDHGWDLYQQPSASSGSAVPPPNPLPPDNSRADARSAPVPVRVIPVPAQ